MIEKICLYDNVIRLEEICMCGLNIFILYVGFFINIFDSLLILLNKY